MLLNSLRNRLQTDIGLWGFGIPGVSFVPENAPRQTRVEEARNRDTSFFDIRRRGYFGFPLFLFSCHDGCLGVDASNDRCDMVILT